MSSMLLFGLPIPAAGGIYAFGWTFVAVPLLLMVAGSFALGATMLIAVWPDLSDSEMVEEISWCV